MKIFKFLLIWLVAFASCSSQKTPQTEQAAPTPAAAAKSFPLAASFNLDDYKGKIVLLNFWATWCGPCRIEIPDLVKIDQSFDRSQVVVIGISTAERGPPDQVHNQLSQLVDRFQITYPIIFDDQSELHRAFGYFTGIPTTFLIDRDGKVKKSFSGVRPYKVFAEAIQELLDRS